MGEQSEKLDAVKRLRTVRNIGIVTAEELYSIGIKTPEQLMEANPEKVYEKIKAKNGGKLDRCVLYQLRGAHLDKPWWKCKDQTKQGCSR